MGGWFNIDSKFYRFCSYVGDFIILMVLWAIFSLPVITIGASTTAAYYVATRQLSSREGYIWKDFLKSFKSNFIQSTLSTIIFALIGAVIYINIEFLEKSSIFFPVQFVLLYELTITVIYTFPLLSRFNFKFFKLLKTAFLMANKHLLTTISCLVLLGAGFTLITRSLGVLSISYTFPIFFVVLFCMGLYIFVTSLMFMKLFRKYVPDMDKDPEEIF